MIITSQKLLFTRQDAPSIGRGAVVLSRGTMIAAGPTDKILPKYPGHRVVRMENAVLMPGLINVHAHLELPSLLDTVRAGTFSEWVLNLVRSKRKLNSTDYTIAAEQNIRDLAQCGTTTVGEICTHKVSSGILRQSGLRAVIYNEFIGMDPLHDITHLPALLSRPSSLVHYGLSPHTPYTVSETALRAINQLSRKKDIRLAMHIAESRDETRLLQGKKSGLRELYRLVGWDLAWTPSAASSFEYLLRIGFLSRRLLAVHVVQVTDRDIAIMKKAKVSVAHCPRSNNEIGTGRMPLAKLLAAGIPVGLGTDSLASSPSLNMWDEMRYAYRIHRRNGVTPKDILTIATIGGARALGLDAETGSLEPGKRADIIAVSLPKKDTGDLYSDLLRETKSCIMTMVNGRILHRES